MNDFQTQSRTMKRTIVGKEKYIYRYAEGRMKNNPRREVGGVK